MAVAVLRGAGAASAVATLRATAGGVAATVAALREGEATWALGGAAWAGGFAARMPAVSTAPLPSMKAMPIPAARTANAKR